MHLYFQNFIIIYAFCLLLWLFSVKLKNSSIIDPFWGMFFVVSTWHFVLNTPVMSKRGLLITFCTTLWGLRLSIYLFLRNYKKGEDKRYRTIRNNDPERFWWTSLFKVFLLQGTIAGLICIPMYLGITSTGEDLRWFEFVGLSLFYFGFLWETQADWQLSQFKLNRKNEEEILDTGLWAYTRHPNYFGEIILWYGYAGMVLATPYSWLAVLAAVSMNYLIIHFSGVKPLEQCMTNRKSKYFDYIQTVPTFVPWGLLQLKKQTKEKRG